MLPHRHIPRLRPRDTAAARCRAEITWDCGDAYKWHKWRVVEAAKLASAAMAAAPPASAPVAAAAVVLPVR